MTWWAVLYALSMLTRYEPGRWTTITNIERSRHAVRVEHLLDTAQETVPNLIMQAVTAIDDAGVTS
jgi:hypothetical protein